MKWVFVIWFLSAYGSDAPRIEHHPMPSREECMTQLIAARVLTGGSYSAQGVVVACIPDPPPTTDPPPTATSSRLP